jgi:hypothetical protein
MIVTQISHGGSRFPKIFRDLGVARQSESFSMRGEGFAYGQTTWELEVDEVLHFPVKMFQDQESGLLRPGSHYQTCYSLWSETIEIYKIQDRYFLPVSGREFDSEDIRRILAGTAHFASELCGGTYWMDVVDGKFPALLQNS